MSRRIFWIAILFVIGNYRLTGARRHPRYDLENLLKMGLDSFDKNDTDDNESEAADDDDYDYDEYDDGVETSTESAVKEPDKPNSPVMNTSTGSGTSSQKQHPVRSNQKQTLIHPANDYNLKRDVPRTQGDGDTRHGGLRMRDRTNLLRIKTAADRIESLLDTFNLGYNVHYSGSSNSNATVNSVHETQQTTISPFPGAYRGYAPVPNKTGSLQTSASENHSIRPSNNSKRSPNSIMHSLDAQVDDSRWRRVAKQASSQGKNKTQAKNETLTTGLDNGKESQTKGLQMTVVKTSNCSKSSPVETDILKTTWTLQQMVSKLGKDLEKNVRKLGNQGTDNTNEERADIKTNSDRVSQLQQGLSGKIDDLRYNISTLMTSQTELGKIVSGALKDMMDVLKEMVTMVTGGVTPPEKFNRNIKAPSANRPNVATKINTTATKPMPHTGNSLAEKNKQAAAKNATRGVPQKQNKDQLDLHKKQFKSQNIGKGENVPPASRLQRRDSKLTENNTSFHNDHSLVNKFKNTDNSKDMPLNQNIVPIDRQRSNMTNNHYSQSTGRHKERPTIKPVPKRQKLKSALHQGPKHFNARERLNEVGHKPNGQNIAHGRPRHMRPVLHPQPSKVHSSHSSKRNARFKDADVIDRQLQEILNLDLDNTDD